jgi:hypothetical protein
VTEGDFTPWVHALERTVLKKDKFLENTPAESRGAKQKMNSTDSNRASESVVREFPDSVPVSQVSSLAGGSAAPASVASAPPKGSSKPEPNLSPLSDFGSKLQSVLNLEK